MGNLCSGGRTPSKHAILKPGLDDSNKGKRRTSKDPLVEQHPTPSRPSPSPTPAQVPSPPRIDGQRDVDHTAITTGRPANGVLPEPTQPAPKQDRHIDPPPPTIVVSEHQQIPILPPPPSPKAQHIPVTPPVTHVEQIAQAPAIVPVSPDHPIVDKEEDLKRKRKIEIFEQMFQSDPLVGYLEKDRLRSLLEQMRILDPNVHEFLWRQYDTDGDGKVNFQEFCQMMFDVMDIKKNFEAADLNHDKSISSTEIVAVLTKLNINLDEHSIALIMNLFDTNHDKGIDFSEFFPLSIFLTTLEYQFKEYTTKKEVRTRWLRPMLGGDIKKEEQVAKELETLLTQEESPSMDIFVRIIVSAASSAHFKDFKAPSIELKEKEKARRTQNFIKPLEVIVKRQFDSHGLYEDHEFVPGSDVLPSKMAGRLFPLSSPFFRLLPFSLLRATISLHFFLSFYRSHVNLLV
jgi:hypothetical protein